MSAAGAKEGQRLLNTGSDAYGTTFGPVNAAYWKWNFFYVFLGAFFWQYLTPPVEQCVEFRLSWMALIAVRNVSFLWIWVGALHHLLYVWHVVPDKLKFNPSYPKKQQHYRDFLMSTSGALIDSAMQIGFMHLYATNKVPWYSDFWAGPQWAQQLGSWQGPTFSMVMILVGCLYQDFHFYWVHRYIHRWGWPEKSFPYFDPGRFLYKWVHSYHHKSYNPGPWSGLAMHPVEHLLYFTRSFVCLFIGLHPVHMMAAFSRSTLSPAPGHNGFGDGRFGGSRYHFLHHAFLECNYGTSPVMPFDHMLGSYRDDPPKFAKVEGDTSKGAIFE